jgi:hypothetical protein
MRMKVLLTTLLMLMPVPALADVTARYSAGSKEVVIEVDDGGDHRAEIAGAFILIRRNGVDYLAAKNPKGDYVVTRADAFFAMLSSQLKGIADVASKNDEKMKFQLIPGGTNETVAGRVGTLWRFGPLKPDASEADRNRELLEFVMSADPQLAPVGRVFLESLKQVLPVVDMLLADADLSARAAELFAKGTPIRIGKNAADDKGLKLVSVDTADIAASRFELPGAEVEPMEFFQSVGPDSGARAMPKLH